MGVFVSPEETYEAKSLRGGRQQFNYSEVDTWVRPSDWLTLPAVTASDNKFVGLFAVTNDNNNFVALTAGNNYTVDWGDGTVENFANGIQANHQYTYSSISSSTNCSRGYRQVLITVTPQSGQSFLYVNIDKNHTALTNANAPKWLDIVIAGSLLNNNTRFGGASFGLGQGIGYGNVWIWMLERIRILSSSINYMYYSMPGLTALETFELQTSSATLQNSGTFYNCTKLKFVNIPKTVITNASSMFSQCISLEYGPPLDTTGCTLFTSMFSGCTALRAIPSYKTNAATSFDSMFYNCYSLREVPQFTTTNVLNNTYGMFNNCSKLKSISLFDTSGVTNTGYMFWGCLSLNSIPNFNFSSSLSANAMFSYCYKLISLPNFDTSKITNIDSFVYGCGSLLSIPAFDFSSVTSASSAFAYLTSVASSSATGLKIAHGYPNSNFSQSALETIFTNLGRASGGSQSLTITGNLGAPTPVSLSGTTTSGSSTITMASTTGLSTDMEISGTGISSAVSVTFEDTGDTVTRTSHGLSNGTAVSFSSITSTTGILTYTRYYVVNATANTFQVSDSIGGAAKALTTNGSGNMLYATTITTINPNVSITISVPASASGTITTSSALLKRSIARLKGWAVTG